MSKCGESRLALDKGIRKMSEETKQLQIVAQRGSGVSSALWPVSAQKCVATSKEAQRRRYMIIQGKRWAVWPILAAYSSVSLSLVFIALISMVMSGAVVAALAWHLWYMLLVTVLLLPLLFNVRAKTEVRSLLLSLRCAMQAKTSRSTRKTSGNQGKQAPAAKSMARLHVQVAPKTPMPEESFVRVLETVDLSQANVEHFIGADAESKEHGDGEDGTRERNTAALILNLKAELAPVKNITL